MANLPTGTVTFLFTDIEGSTALLQHLGDRRYAEVLEEHRRLLRDAFAEGHGQEVDTQGDAFLVVFPRARDALAAAVAAQQALMKHAWLDGASLRVRMGLHTGEPISETGDYVGLDVHRAARICAAGHGGQILLSQTVVDLAAHDLPTGVRLRNLGTHRLKDLHDPEHLFQVIHPDLLADFPLLKSLSARPNHNLPISLTSFIGRTREIAEVKRLLNHARLVTLTGSGGAGKTRLALQVAADLLDTYPDGVWFVEFAPLADPALVPKTVALALNVPEQPARDMTDTLLDALRLKTLLLVLDNCEHLLAACAELAVALLRVCSQVRFLATSREGLAVPGETLWRVPSLSLPDARGLPPPEDLIRYEAVRLFVERAEATTPGFTATRENAPAVARVCQRLDGIPLAIELAAARVNMLTVEQIAARLDDRFRLLAGVSRTVVPRQQTLRATMDWSYGLMTEREQMSLGRLSVFAGGWTVEAAETVCIGTGIDTTSILDLLTSLANKSLIIAETQRGEARYRLLETVRQYGAEKLQERGEAAGVRRRHRNWFLALAERAEPEVWGPAQVAWLERLDREHDNLRTALQWSKEDDPVGGLRLAGALWWFWFVRGHFEEGRGWLETLLGSARGAPEPVRAKALHAAGHLASQGQADYVAGRRFCEESLAVWRKLRDMQGVALALNSLGILAFESGDHTTANAYFEEGLAMRRSLGDRAGVATSLINLGLVARRRGDLTTARTLYLESLVIFRDLRQDYRVARALGFVAELEDDLTVRRSLVAESLTIRRRIGHKQEIAESLDAFSALAIAEGQATRAARLLGAADALREAIGVGLSPLYLATHTPAVVRTQSKLGDESFSAAWAEGRAMTLEQAVEYALTGETG